MVNTEKSLWQKFKIKSCELLGHDWQYKDYTNHINANGEKYEFSESRQCLRCEVNQYLYSDWKTEKHKTAL